MHVTTSKPAKVAAFTFNGWPFTASAWLLNQYTGEHCATVRIDSGAIAFCTLSTDPNEGFCAIASDVDAHAFSTDPAQAVRDLARRIL